VLKFLGPDAWLHPVRFSVADLIWVFKRGGWSFLGLFEGKMIPVPGGWPTIVTKGFWFITKRRSF
jgi:hypothetical protein